MTDAQQPAEYPGKDQRLTIGKDKNVEFERLRRSDLKSIPLFAQALDNQWLPRDLLKQAQEKGKVTTDIDRKLRKTVRAEYIRSLINGEQVVFNRAYLYNNPAISQDFELRNSPEYQAFKALLEKKAIIAWLLEEESPTDKPVFDVQEQAFARWIELCQEVRIPCVRLSWNTKENKWLKQTQLDRRFSDFVGQAVAEDINVYIQDLMLDQRAEDSLRQTLSQMAQLGHEFNSQGKQITRNILYKEFVTAGRNPADRHYDSSPLSGAVKQLIDLRYNSNVPDAFNGYLITPIDSPPRTVLQEWKDSKPRPIITARELLTLLQRTTFDLIGNILNVPSMDMLQLPDVHAIRATDEWKLYMQDLQALLEDPMQFADGLASRAYQSYATLTQRITGLISQQPGKGSLLTTWKPTVELVFNIAGAILSYCLTNQEPQWQLKGKMVEEVAGDTVPIIGTFVIRHMDQEHPKQDFSINIDFMHFQMPDVQEQWKEIEREVRHFPGFQEHIAPPEEDSTISYNDPLE